MWMQQQAARTYFEGQAVTAGRLKAWQLLLEKAMVLLHKAARGDGLARRRAQDIVAQVQNGLDLSQPASPDIFKSLGIVWDALDAGGEALSKRSGEVLVILRDIIEELQRRRDRGF